MGKRNVGGSTIDWVMRTQGVSFSHAVELHDGGSLEEGEVTQQDPVAISEYGDVSLDFSPNGGLTYTVHLSPRSRLNPKRVHTSVNAARMSACATN
jgi:hypothetical protein